MSKRDLVFAAVCTFVFITAIVYYFNPPHEIIGEVKEVGVWDGKEWVQQPVCKECSIDYYIPDPHTHTTHRGQPVIIVGEAEPYQLTEEWPTEVEITITTEQQWQEYHDKGIFMEYDNKDIELSSDCVAIYPKFERTNIPSYDGVVRDL